MECVRVTFFLLNIQFKWFLLYFLISKYCPETTLHALRGVFCCINVLRGFYATFLPFSLADFGTQRLHVDLLRCCCGLTVVLMA